MVVRRAFRQVGDQIQVQERVLGLGLDPGGIPDHHYRTEAAAMASEILVLVPEGNHDSAGGMVGEVCYNPLHLEEEGEEDGCIDPVEEDKSHPEVEEDRQNWEDAEDMAVGDSPAEGGVRMGGMGALQHH